MSEPGCPFCDKLARENTLGEGEVVWTFPHSVALLGEWQAYHGYCVLVSRRHARELFELPDDERRGYLEELCMLARAIDQAVRPHKLNYELLGNQVPHLHWHVFPRAKEDPDRLAPVWRTLEGAERDAGRKLALQQGPETRKATVEKLRQALAVIGAPRP